ncbi:MAG: serine/threonine-protein kinase [Myxococcota bacterium]
MAESDESTLDNISESHDFDEALGVDSIDLGILEARIIAKAFGDETPSSITESGELAEASDRYVIERRLGSGAMGMVYLARDLELDRNVALKVLRPNRALGQDSSSDARLSNQIRREAQAMARLSHPNVVHVHDVGSIRGRLFVAMELVEGGTMATWLRAVDRSWREVVGVFRAAARGLHAAHEADLVHRDFKPDNVLMTHEGVAKVTDFGLARVSEELRARQGESLGPAPDDSEGASLSVGSIKGTPAYMAPEHIRGLAGDARSDQFSFCVSLYEALYGERPFHARDTVSLLANIMSGDRRPVPSRSLPRRLVALVNRGLSPSPDDRFESMAQLEAELERCELSFVRRYWMPLAAVSLIAAMGIGGMVVQRAKSRDCEREAARVDELWSSTRRNEVERAILESELPYAPPTWRAVETQLGNWTSDWRDEARQACVRREDDVMAGRRASCLEVAALDFAGTVEVLRTASPQLAPQASQLVHRIADPTRCADDTWLRTGTAPPPPPELREQVYQARQQLSQSRSLHFLGRLDEALELAQQTRETAKSLDYPALLVEAEHRVTAVELNYQPDQGASRWRDVYVMAVREDLTAIAVSAALFMIRSSTYDPGRHGEAQMWGQIAEAHISRFQEQASSLEAIRLRSLANVEARTGNLERALELARAAREMAAESLHEDDPRHAAFLMTEANAELSMNRQDSALEHIEQGLAMEHRLYGDIHPSIAGLETFRAEILMKKGQLDEAYAGLERILTIYQATLPEGHSAIGDTLANMGHVLRRQGRLEEALTRVAEGYEVSKKALGPEHDSATNAQLTMALIELDLGRLEDALTRLDKVLPAIGKQGTERELYQQALQLSSNIQFRLGRFDAADETSRKNLEIIEAITDPGHREHRYALWLRASVLRERGQLTEALSLLDRCIELPVTQPPQEPKKLQCEVARLDLWQRMSDPRGSAQALEAKLGELVDSDDEFAAEHRARLRFALARNKAGWDDPESARALADQARKELGEHLRYAQLRREIGDWAAALP